MQQSRFRYIHDTAHCLPGDDNAPCFACGRKAPEFGFIVLRDDGCDEYDVCESCLRSGALKNIDVAVNYPDLDSFVNVRRPGISDADQEAYIWERSDEVAYQTPRPAIQNEFRWPVHCFDYLTFHRPVYPEDLDRLASDGNGRAYFLEHQDSKEGHWDQEDVDAFWASGGRGAVTAYLWRCAECSEFVITCEWE